MGLIGTVHDSRVLLKSFTIAGLVGHIWYFVCDGRACSGYLLLSSQP